MKRYRYLVLGFLLCAYDSFAQEVQLIPYRKGDKWGYCTPDKKIIIPCEYDKAWEFIEGLAAVQKGGKWGFINTAGELVVPCVYDEVGYFYEGVAFVKRNNKEFYISREGVEYYED
ncbi:MAG: WG repeat-containing protein [Cytophagales bacterium]|nr:WG repeat-containing protein [Bernardetiaceae bacterium]MDW8210135.1 WG repeat-containing protein [Cytophagales bacterium]